MGRGHTVGARLADPVVVRVGFGAAVIAAVCIAQVPSLSAADSSFFNGTATATAESVVVSSSIGQLNVSVDLGTAQGAYQNNEGKALSQTLDLGVIGDVLEAPNCQSGKPSSVQSSDFPQPIQAESTDGPQSSTSTAETSLRGTPFGVGNESVSATQQPLGTATTTIASDDLAGLVNVSGAVTQAQAAVTNGNTRSATATSDISSVSLANGLVVLHGLHWVAQQTSGASSTSTGSFDISGITIAGVYHAVSSNTVQSSVLPLVNTLLSPTGLNIRWPQVLQLSDGTQSVTPLIVGFDNSALGQEVIGANLSKLQTVREKLQSEIYALDCNIPAYVTVADVEIGVLAGGGNLDVDLGGTRAITNDVMPVSPFGPTDLGLGLGTATDSGQTLPSTFTAGTPGTPGTPGSFGPAPTTTSTATGASGPTQSLGPVTQSTSCRSIGPAGGGCGSSNMAVPVGLIALALLAALAAWDYTRQRRRRRIAGLEGEA